jgi:V/A-type H+-transporting ATPase subunit I
MIVTMKKVSIVTLKRYEEESLQELRDLGVLHVFTHGVEGGNGDALREQSAVIERALAAIPVPDGGDASFDGDSDAAVDKALEIGEEVQKLLDERSLLNDELDRLRREVDRFAPWGDPLPGVIARLNEGGVEVRLYELSSDIADDAIAQMPHAIVVSRSKTLVRVVGVAVGDEALPEGIIPIDIPDRTIAEIGSRITEVQQRLAGIESELTEMSARRPILNAAMAQLDDDFEFVRVAATMDSEKELSWITGFVPSDIVDTVKSAAADNGWASSWEIPKRMKQVPTKIENPKPIGIIQPVFNLLGTVPGYREMDISFFFLPLLHRVLRDDHRRRSVWSYSSWRNDLLRLKG